MDTQTLIATLEAAPGIIIGLVREVPPRTSSAALRRTSGPLTSMPVTSTGHAEFLSRLELMLSDPLPK